MIYITILIFAIIWYLLYQRLMKILKYLNFKISVLQRLLFKKYYKEIEDIYNFHPEEDDYAFLEMKYAEDNEVEGKIKKDIDWAIDSVLRNDFEHTSTINAIKYGSKIGIFDTTDGMHKIFNSDEIIDRFNKNIKDLIKSGKMKKIET